MENVKIGDISGRHDTRLAILMMIAAMSLAGSSVVVGKILSDTIPVFLASFGSLLVAFLGMLPLMRGKSREIYQLTMRDWKYLFLQGLCGIVLFRVFILYGLQSTGAIQAGIITGTTPAVLGLLSFILLREKLTRQGVTGLLLAVCGCVVINLVDMGGSGENSILGCILVGCAVVSESLFTIFRKKVAESVSAVTNTTVLVFCSLLLLALPAAYDYSRMETGLSLEASIAIIYYGLFATVLAYLLWTAAVGKVNGAIAGASTAAMPASSVLLAALILGEKIELVHFAGCLFIITGILVTTGYNPVHPIRAFLSRGVGRNSR